MLDFHKLEIFQAVVETGSFSLAAERLFLTQAAVSQHIKELEASVGTELFVRGRRGVTLTPSGQILADYARRILDLVTEAAVAVTDVANLKRGEIRLGATPGIGSYVLPGWMQSFRKAYPQLTLSLTTDVTQRIVELLQQDRLDLAFIEGELEEMDWLGYAALQGVQQYVVVGRGHAWCALEAIPLEALYTQKFVMRSKDSQTRRWLESQLAKHGVVPEIAAEFDSPEALKQAVIAGMGITILPDYTLRLELQSKLLRALPLEGVSLNRVLKLIWNRQKPFGPITRAFLKHLADEFPALHNL
ncbi:MAG: LysR family transcriptional regulator [Chloroflexota bacterium]|nr:LysR family transcriptional regulator [Chloroflexota bacterium]NOG64817.1 LysR family transcriptional regulator [Chloroflexota bacterium]GIK63292.1 MAG: LysR family transcriptional regulator [Chloroflexota bacterium]